MAHKIRYALMYKKWSEIITLDDFESVFAALDYCRKERIEDPLEIRRIETTEEQMLDRAQIEKLLTYR